MAANGTNPQTAHNLPTPQKTTTKKKTTTRTSSTTTKMTTTTTTTATKDDEKAKAKAREEAKALRKGAEADGIVTKESTGLFSSKKVIDQDTLQNMTDNQLGEFAKAYADDDDLFPLLQAEAERRKMSRSKPPAKNPGTVQSALQPEAVVAVENDYANPAAVISAPEQPAVSRSQEMMMSQAQLDNTKTKQSGGGNTSVTAASTTVSTSNVTNNSYTSMPLPSTKDTSDQTYIFRATGTSR